MRYPSYLGERVSRPHQRLRGERAHANAAGGGAPGAAHGGAGGKRKRRALINLNPRDLTEQQCRCSQLTLTRNNRYRTQKILLAGT